MADTRTPASRRAASSASASRLPSARERRPALAALAVLLIVGGAFASGFLALQAGDRADYLRVKTDVPQGAEITDADLESVSLPEDLDGVISADDQDDVVGLHAVTPLLAGTILTEDMMTDSSGIPEGMVRIAIGLDAAALNVDLQEGATITLYTWSDESEDTDTYSAEVVAVNDSDDDVGGDGGTSTSQVVVLMDAAEAEAAQPAIDDERVRIGETSPESSDEENATEGGE